MENLQEEVMTTKERSYIQSFPESFEFVGTTSSVEQAIGNAVPVKMAEYVASVIADYQ
jgi:DNA (cytosine-5)-methyltransferase 1